MSNEHTAPGFFLRVGPPTLAGGGYRATSEDLVQLDAKVLSLKFEDDEQKPDKLTITVDNHDLRLLDTDLLAKGNVIAFQFGYPGRTSPARTAVIQSVKGFQLLTVEAHSDEVTMNRVARPDRVLRNMTRSEAVRTILKEHGYSEDVVRFDIEDTKEVRDTITQGPQTDFQFIRELAQREGFEFYVDFDGVHFHRRRLDQKPIKTYRYFTERGRGEVLTVSIDDDIAPERRKAGAITMVGSNPDTGQRFAVRVDNTTIGGHPTLMPTLTVHEAKIEDPQAKAHRTSGSELVLRTSEKTEEAAKRQAEAWWRKLQLRAVKLTLGVVGDPNMVAKSVVRVEGIGQRFSGLYYVRTVVHELNPSAPYRMTLKLSTDGHNMATGGGELGTPPGPAASGTQNPAAQDGSTADPDEVVQERGDSGPGTETRGRGVR